MPSKRATTTIAKTVVFTTILTLGLLNTSAIAADDNAASAVNDTSQSVDVDTAITTDTSDNDTNTVNSRRRKLKKNISERHPRSVDKVKDRKERYKDLKHKRNQKFEGLKRKWENSEDKREKLKERFSELQAKRLERIQNRGNLIIARLTKASEALYSVLEKISNHLDDRADAGFDVSELQSMVDQAETDLQAADSQRDSLEGMLDNLEGLSADEIPSALRAIKDSAVSTKKAYGKVRNDIVNIINTVRR